MASEQMISVALLGALGFFAVVTAPSVVAQEGEAATLQDQGETSVLASASMPFWVEEGRLAGEGAELLVRRASEADFILFGEQHGVAGLAAIVQAVVEEIEPDVLVTERGLWISHEIQNLGIDEAARRHPHSIAFSYDGDLDLLRAYEDLASAQGRPRGVWGVDQEVTAIHPLVWLSSEEAESNPSVRRLARGLSLKATFHAGEYLRQPYFGDLDRLAARLTVDEVNAEALVGDLNISMDIYTRYRAGARTQAAQLREAYMIEMFESQLADWRRREGESPSVVFKMGGAHIIEGIGPNGIPTLGDHVQRLADANGLTAFHIGIRRYSQESLPELAPLFVGPESNLLIDTAALRALIGTPTLQDIPENFHDDIAGFDAVILIGSPGWESRSEISGLEAAWNNAFLLRVALSFWPILILISATLWAIASGLIGLIRIRSTAALSPLLICASVYSAVSAFVVLDAMISSLFVGPSLSVVAVEFYPFFNVAGALLAAGCLAFFAARSVKRATYIILAATWTLSILWTASSIHLWHLPV